MKVYEPRLQTFLRALEAEERKINDKNVSTPPISLSMRFLGPNEDQDHRCRLQLLSESQKAEMSALVATKLGERLHRKIVQWDEDSAVACAHRLLDL